MIFPAQLQPLYLQHKLFLVSFKLSNMDNNIIESFNDIYLNH
jgi:hypothetical protein